MARRRRGRRAGPGGVIAALAVILLLALGVADGRIDLVLPDIEDVFASQPAAQQPDAPAQSAPDTQSAPAAQGEGMTLTVLEVGKADCLVLQCGGETMIVDGGNEGDEAYILARLEEMGIDGFDLLVNTHPHEDHLGSLDAVVERYPVEQAYLSPREHTTRSYENLLAALEERDVPTDIPQPGDQWQLGGATITVLSPDPDADYDGYNDWSIVLMAQYGDVRYLLMGDAEAPVESDLMDSGLPLEADVLKVGHHGSSTSSRKAFLRAVDPDLALITCDRTEKAGEPHEEVARRLDELEIPVMRTDLQGVLTVRTDGVSVEAQAERPAA